MTFTIDQDIDFLRDLAEEIAMEHGQHELFQADDYDRLNSIADRLEEIERIMPVVFALATPELMEAIDRTLDMLEQEREGGQLSFDLDAPYGGTE